jgi:hypothetical protein
MRLLLLLLVVVVYDVPQAQEAGHDASAKAQQAADDVRSS